MSDRHTVTPTVTNMTTSESGEVASTSPYTLDLNPMEEIDSNQEQPPTTPIKERTTDAYGMVSSTVSPLVDGGGSVSATLPPCDLDDFSPVLSKSARRRQARKIGAEARARQIASHTGGGGGHRTGGSGSGSGSGSVQFRHSTSAYELSNPSVASVPSHMLVHHSPYHRVGGRHGIIVQLKDMFPSIEEDVLESLYSTFGSFDGVVEYMLQHEAAESHHEKQLAAALHASTLESQGVVSSASPFVSGSGGWSAIASGAPPLPSSPSPSTPLLSSTSPPFAMSTSSSPLLAPTGVDRLSPLTVDLFYPICDHLDLFDLANLCGTNHEIQRQVDTVLHRVDGLDFSKQRYGHWTDRRMLGMISRFPSTTSLSFRNTEFRSFDQLHRHCFGSSIRHLSVAGCLALEDYHLTELFELGDHLTSLDLTQTEVTDDGLDYIATARTNKVLEKLALTGCKFTSSMGIQRILDRCKSLRQLDLKGTNVTKSALTFQQQSQLQSINLSTCRRLPAEFSITSEFCRLVAINLSSNPSLKNVTLVIPTLTQLNLSNSKHLQTLTLHTPKLTLLNLNGCLVLSKIAPYVPYSATFLSAISTLNTNGCRSITGLSFDRLFQSSKTTLTSLTCRGCLLLTDANLALLLRDDKSESSSLQVDDSSLVLSNPSHCQLVFLDLSGCKAASSSVIMTLQRQVAAHQSYLHQQAQLEATKSTLPTSAGFGNFSSSPDHEVWAGGLDDEEYDENEDSSEESGNSGALSEAML